MLSYCGGGVSIGGGGSSSSNAGGLKDGWRSRCIGLLSPELGLCKWAACGRVKPAEGRGGGCEMMLRLEEDELFPV
jgi:hypothetical protein